MPAATPYINNNPSVVINETEVRQHLRSVRLTPENNWADVGTYENVGGEAPGTPKWSFSADGLQSFGPEGSNAGLWDTLQPLMGQKVTVVVKPKDEVVSPTNPSATFDAYVAYTPFLDSEMGQSTVVPIELRVIGRPVFADA